MAKHGMLFETDAMIPQAIIRGVICTEDVDGGQPIALGAKHGTEKDLFVATKFATGKTGLYIAYNPSRMYEVGEDGVIRPSQIVDPRYHYNVKDTGFTAFKPIPDMYFGLTMANVDGATAPTVGKFLEPKNGEKTYEIKSTQTDDVTSFEVIDIKTVDIETCDFTDSSEPVYIVKCLFN